MNPILTTTTRNGLVETVHRGAWCMVGEGGKVVASVGDIELRTYPRSAMKLVQVLPLILTGAADALDITPEEIALMCGSHNAEDRHRATALSILEKAAATEADLACGTHDPLSRTVHHSLIASATPTTALYNNCSGKHAGFLALARHIGAPLKGYLLPDHPVQIHVREAVVRIFGLPETELHHGIDGCSAPNYGMPLRHMALGYQRLAAPENLPANWSAAIYCVTAAISAHPFMIAGTDRYCTELMSAAPNQVIAKLGADGVYCMALPHRKRGIAVKIDDGATGPQYNVAQTLLEAQGIFRSGTPERLKKFKETPILNCKGLQVGARTATEIVQFP
ncbi:MAG: asparaginase [Bacteroidota bacterium]